MLLRAQLSICSLIVPHLQAAAEPIPHMCVSERNRSTPVRRRLSLTHAGLGKLIPGGVGITFPIDLWSPEVFFATPCSIYIPPIVLH